jgi:hypothetical protein
LKIGAQTLALASGLVPIKAMTLALLGKNFMEDMAMPKYHQA